MAAGARTSTSHANSWIFVVVVGLVFGIVVAGAAPRGMGSGGLRFGRRRGGGIGLGDRIPVVRAFAREGPRMSESTALLAGASLLLVPLAIAGLALINTGFGRSRNATHLMMASLCLIGIAAAVYVVCGYCLQGVAGGPAWVIAVAGRYWNWAARQPLFLRGIDLYNSPEALVVWLQILAVALAAMIPVGAGAERWRLGAMCASTAIFAGVTYPLFAHWTWGGGWLAGLGFVDVGGSGNIHATGGLTALAIVWVLGPRRGKYTAEGMPTAMPAHNAVFVLFGCFLAWAGWMGLNTAGALLVAGVDPRRAGLIGINTTLAAGSAALMTAVVTRVRFSRPDASLTANGWVAGLVAGSAGCAVVPPAAAIFIGLIAGLVTPLAIENLEARLSIDDPGGAIAVHAVGGIWGLIAVGIFGRFPAGQWVAQFVGVATLVGFVLPLSYGLNRLLARFLPPRVTPEAERQGLDLHDLGAGAYPEFLTHADDFLQR
jgi:ammonium transporter, Amt family